MPPPPLPPPAATIPSSFPAPWVGPVKLRRGHVGRRHRQLPATSDPAGSDRQRLHCHDHGVLASLTTPTTYSNSEPSTVTVTNSTNGDYPTGMVNWMVGKGKVVGSAFLSPTGTAGVSTATFDLGDNLQAGAGQNVYAVYAGSSEFTPSSSAAQAVTVNQDGSSTSLAAEYSPVAIGRHRHSDSDRVRPLRGPIRCPPRPRMARSLSGTGRSAPGVNLGTVPVSEVIVNQEGCRWKSPSALHSRPPSCAAGTQDLVRRLQRRHRLQHQHRDRQRPSGLSDHNHRDDQQHRDRSPAPPPR